MEFRLARFLAIALVIVVLGGLLLSGRARKLERQLAAAPTARTVPSGPLDSARAVALALDAYRTDHVARGEVAPAARVASFVSDSVGFQIALAPADSTPGTRAIVHVLRSGAVELRRVAP